jgi:phosphatidylserine decarboxylase
MEEIEKPLEEYQTMSEFFTRRLKPGSRNIESGLVSPVDGTVLHFGEISNPHQIEQVKGVNYSVEKLLGLNSPIVPKLQGNNSTNNRFYHAIIYLSPGDYHRIHSPTNFVIQSRTHFPGDLLSVAPKFVQKIPGLFAVNERVVISGKWQHGNFTITPVGASNVGSITLQFDPQLRTNVQRELSDPLLPQHKTFTNVNLQAGEEMAVFQMGSTVVLIFEAPPTYQFTLQPGQKVKLGQTIGKFSNPTPAPPQKNTNKNQRK